MAHASWSKGEFKISTDPSLLDVNRIHAFLSQSYWSAGIPRELVQKSIDASLPFGIYSASGEQVGFARVISDFATFAYLGDVYVEEAWRGKGLSKWLMECVMGHPQLQGLRRFCLGTRDAHGLYAQFGFRVVQVPANWMEIKKVDLYGSRAI